VARWTVSGHTVGEIEEEGGDDDAMRQLQMETTVAVGLLGKAEAELHQDRKSLTLLRLERCALDRQLARGEADLAHLTQQQQQLKASSPSSSSPSQWSLRIKEMAAASSERSLHDGDINDTGTSKNARRRRRNEQQRSPPRNFTAATEAAAAVAASASVVMASVAFSPNSNTHALDHQRHVDGTIDQTRIRRANGGGVRGGGGVAVAMKPKEAAVVGAAAAAAEAAPVGALTVAAKAFAAVAALEGREVAERQRRKRQGAKTAVPNAILTSPLAVGRR